MREYEFKDQVVVVTGGARGIGFAIVESFARCRATTVIADLDHAGGMHRAAALQARGYVCSYLHVDLREKGAPQQMVNEVVAQHGTIDVLVNNARSGSRLTGFEENETTWEETMAVTLRAAFLASQEAIMRMAVKKRGSIVTVGSILASLISAESPSYHAAKAGLRQITRYLAVLGGEYAIRANMVSPGFIVQDEHIERFNDLSNANYRRQAERAHPLRRVGTSGDVAEAVTFLASSAAGFITGQEIVVDGGLTIQEQSSLMLTASREKK